jgi:hypothetical protein
MYGGADQVTGVTRLTPGLPALDVTLQPPLLAVHGEPPFTLAETLGAVEVDGYMTTT